VHDPGDVPRREDGPHVLVGLRTPVGGFGEHIEHGRFVERVDPGSGFVAEDAHQHAGPSEQSGRVVSRMDGLPRLRGHVSELAAH
jgi:hypothetical protein